MSAVHFGLVVTVTNWVALVVVNTRCNGITFYVGARFMHPHICNCLNLQNPVNRLIHSIELIVLSTYFF